MYAVVKIGGKQLKVTEGQTIDVEKLSVEAGATTVFDQVLMIKEEGKSPVVGAPFVAEAKVEALVTAHKRAKKVIVFKYKRRKNHKVKRGHKQPLTAVTINKISV